MSELRPVIEVSIGPSLSNCTTVALWTVTFLPRIGETLNINNYSVKVVDVFYNYHEDGRQVITLIATTGNEQRDEHLIQLSYRGDQ